MRGGGGGGDEECFDENSEFCLRWKCSEGFFKCRTTGKCVPESKVCDGQFDCESGTGKFVL